MVARNKLEPERDQRRRPRLRQPGRRRHRNVARFAALLSGLPPTTPGVTVNRLCASGLQAVVDAARAITVGEGDLYLAGGVESMSRAPYVLCKADSPFSRDVKMFDTTIGARFPNPKVVKQFGNHSMPETGDNVAKDFGIVARAGRRVRARFAAEIRQGGGRGVLQRRNPRRHPPGEEKGCRT